VPATGWSERRAPEPGRRDAYLDELERLVARLDDLVDDADRWAHENLTLHEFICAQAGTHLVEALLRKAMEHWDRLRRYYFEDVFPHRLRESQQEHREIVRALRTRNGDLVERIIREHNQTALAAYVGHISRGTPTRAERHRHERAPPMQRDRLPVAPREPQGRTARAPARPHLPAA